MAASQDLAPLLLQVIESINTLGVTLGTKIDTMGDTLGTKIDTLGTKIDTLGTKIDTLGTKIDSLGARMDRLEGQPQNVQDTDVKCLHQVAENHIVYTRLVRNQFVQNTIFLRPAVRSLWKNLDTCQRDGRPCIVYGSPGIGKSVCTWVWCCEQQHVIYLQCCRGTICFGCTLQRGRIVNRFKLNEKYGSSAIEKCRAFFGSTPLFVIDGAVNDENIPLEMGEESWIVCASHSVRIKGEFNATLKKTTMYSWTLSEYLSAIKIPELGEKLQRLENSSSGASLEEIVQHKYFFAGGCARFMFEYDQKETIELIDGMLENVADIQQLITGLEGQKSPFSVNSLFQVSEAGDYYFVSQYATHAVLNKAGVAFIDRCLKIAKTFRNGSMYGTTFEFGIILRLKRLKGAKLFLTQIHHSSPSSGTVDFRWNSTYEYNKIEELSEVKHPALMIPKSYQQGCFDFALFDPASANLWTFQVTVKSTHNFKQQYITQLITALELGRVKVKQVHHVAVCPTTSISDEQHNFTRFTDARPDVTLRKSTWPVRYYKTNLPTNFDSASRYIAPEAGNLSASRSSSNLVQHSVVPSYQPSPSHSIVLTSPVRYQYRR